jgi:hypothetical protein
MKGHQHFLSEQLSCDKNPRLFKHTPNRRNEVAAADTTPQPKQKDTASCTLCMLMQKKNMKMNLCTCRKSIDIHSRHSQLK